MQECIRVVALIYANWALLLVVGYYRIHERLASQLAKALGRTDLDSDWIGMEELLLWILYVGGAVCTGITERRWFVGWAFRIGRKLSLGSWNEARELLTTFFWNEKICERPCRQIWTETEEILVPELDESDLRRYALSYGEELDCFACARVDDGRILDIATYEYSGKAWETLGESVIETVEVEAGGHE
jgi:hypothetical protein